MGIQGTDGTGNQFSNRFASGDVISAGQLNDLINGISTALPQPYLGDGPNISYGSGGTVITSAPNDPNTEFNFSLSLAFGGEDVDHWEIGIASFDAGLGILNAGLKVAKGGNIWRPENSDCDTTLRANVITTDGTLTVIPGLDPTSPWASNDGYILMTVGVTYHIYAFKLEVDWGSYVYIYVSTNGSLANGCPLTLPPGIVPPPGVSFYRLQGLRVGEATVMEPFLPVVNQFILGSITWTNLPPPPASVNHYEAKVVEVDFDGEPTKVLKIGRGGNIWNPSTDAKRNALEKRAEVITPAPEVAGLFAGDDPTSPWASDDGYIVLEPVSLYVYAFKVTSDDGETTNFYIFVSEYDNHTDPVDGKIPLPAGITPPSGPYTVQGVRVADVTPDFSSGAANFVIKQRVIGSITWPDYIPPRIIQPFEVIVDKSIEDVHALRIAKGDFLWTQSNFHISQNGGVDNPFTKPLQGKAHKIWVYPSGSITNGGNPNSPWVNDGGWVALDTAQTYSVYALGNQDGTTRFGPLGTLNGEIALAVIADGSDADEKSRPFLAGYMGRTWATAATPFLEVDGSVYGLGGIGISSNWPYNFNCQRYLIAKVSYNGTEWVVDQRMIGTITISDDLMYNGCRFVIMDEFGEPWPCNYQEEQEAWWGSWSGYTKDGLPSDCTTIVRPPYS